MRGLKLARQVLPAGFFLPDRGRRGRRHRSRGAPGGAQQLERLPAGGERVSAALVLIFLVLLFTDIMGWTKDFPFIKPVRRGGVGGLSSLRCTVVACAFSLAGCGVLPVSPGPAPAPPGNSVELTQVPFFPQEKHQCGPAALAMALSAAGEQVTPEQLVPEVYLPGREGSLQAEMLAGARRHGLVAFPLAGGVDALHAELNAESPVIVLQNLGLDWLPTWHYAVVVGYDASSRQMILRSGVTERLTLDLDVFDASWRGSGRWAMLTLPPGRLPATASAGSYLQAVVALEKTGQARAAQVSYRAATRRWPDSLVAWMGMGNTSHALGDLSGAEHAFREAAQRHPDSAAALNNLAQVLADDRRYPEAIEAARAAVRLGGRDAATAQRTLETVSAQSEGR